MINSLYQSRKNILILWNAVAEHQMDVFLQIVESADVKNENLNHICQQQTQINIFRELFFL